MADVRELERRIESVHGNGHTQPNGMRKRLFLELLTVLNGTGEFESIPENVANTRALTERIYRRLGSDGGFALPRAVYESAHYHISSDSLIKRREVHRSEWDYVSQLARSLNVPVNHGHEELAEQPRWMIDVDESYQVLRVWIRELALQDMLLAGMEAYLVPAGSGRPSTEIYGIVFGSYRVSPQVPGRPGRVSLVDLNVERVCIQHRAQGSPSEVIADTRSEATQLAMGEELFPFWHLLGDFHTHTYRSLGELMHRGGWQYSAVDQAVNIEWCERLRGMGHRPRVALILAITRAGRASAGSQENWNGRPNVMRTTIGRCHCFIAAYRIRPDGRYSQDALTLKCPHLAGH